MGYKTWFHKLQESHNVDSPYKIAQSLVDNAGKLGGSPTINAEALKDDEPVGTTNIYNNPTDPDEGEGGDTLEAQLDELNRQLEREQDEEKRKDLLKQIDEVSAQIAARDKEKKEEEE